MVSVSNGQVSVSNDEFSVLVSDYEAETPSLVLGTLYSAKAGVNAVGGGVDWPVPHSVARCTWWPFLLCPIVTFHLQG